MNGQKLILLHLTLLAAVSAAACSGFYIGKAATTDGTMLIGRTQDSPPWNKCFRVVKVPGGEYGPFPYVASLLPSSNKQGTTINAARNGGKDDGKYHFCAVCANENGVVCAGRVSARIMSRPEVVKCDPPTPYSFGGHNFDTLVAANCRSAREAIDVFADAMRRHGNRGYEILMFADPNEAWYVEVYTTHHWAAVRMPDDAVAVFGNQFMLQDFDPADPHSRASPGLVDFAKRHGFLVPGKNAPINLLKTFSKPLADYSNYRTWFGHYAWAPSTAGAYEESKPMPLFFRPDRKLSAADMFALMRSRYEGVRSPEETGDKTIRTIGTTKQATCHVLALDGRLPPLYAATAWIALGNAEHSVFLPVSPAIAETDPAFAKDQPDPPFRYDPEMAGNAFRRLGALAELNRKWYGAGVRSFWESREAELLAAWPKMLAAAAQDAEGRTRVTEWCKHEQRRAFDDAKRIFDELMWYIIANNRIEGDGSGATSEPKAPFKPAR